MRIRTFGPAGSPDQRKAAGYFDVDVPLADAGEPSLEWAGPGQRPGTQLVVDLDGDGTEDGTLVGEPVYGENWWLAPNTLEGTPVEKKFQDQAPTVGGGGSAQNGPLDAWREAFPNAEITRGGWSLGSGITSEGTINSISIGDDTFYFTSGVTDKVQYRNDVDITLGSAGHVAFRPTGGVRTWTDNDTLEGKSRGLFDVGIPLDEAGEPTIEFRTNSGDIPPGLWLQLDIDDDGESDGTIIKERAYGNDWWLNDIEGPLAPFAPENSGGSGSPLHGGLNQWRDELPEGTTVVQAGWSLGSGVKGDFIIDAITVGLTRYTFSGANQGSVASPAFGEVEAGKAVTIDLDATDPDGDELTYEVEDSDDGTVSVNGNEVTFTADDQVVGVSELTYTVSDGRGGSDTGTITITITKASSSTALTITPSPLTSTKVGVANVQVSSTGYMKGAKVDVYVDQKLVNSGVTFSTGKATLSLKKKLGKGSHTVSAYYRGTDFTKASFKGVKITVK